MKIGLKLKPTSKTQLLICFVYTTGDITWERV